METDLNSTERIMYRFRWQIAFLFLGLIFLGVGIYFVYGFDMRKNDIEILESADTGEGVIVVEISGEVEKPGVYEFDSGARVDDLIKVSGGMTVSANIEWVEKTINRAAVLKDGQKLYIPSADQQSLGESANHEGLYQSDTLGISDENIKLVNINTASLNELEALWGIGPKTGQNIIEQRPYSSVEELMDRGILKNNVFERNRDLLSVY